MVNTELVKQLTESYDNYDYSYNRPVTDVDACKEALDEAIIDYFEFQSNASSLMVECAMCGGSNSLELLQEASFAGFKEKVKGFFHKLLELLIALKNKVVNFFKMIGTKIKEFFSGKKSNNSGSSSSAGELPYGGPKQVDSYRTEGFKGVRWSLDGIRKLQTLGKNVTKINANYLYMRGMEMDDAEVNNYIISSVFGTTQQGVDINKSSINSMIIKYIGINVFNSEEYTITPSIATEYKKILNEYDNTGYEIITALDANIKMTKKVIDSFNAFSAKIASDKTIDNNNRKGINALRKFATFINLFTNIYCMVANKVANECMKAVNMTLTKGREIASQHTRTYKPKNNNNMTDKQYANYNKRMTPLGPSSRKYYKNEKDDSNNESFDYYDDGYGDYDTYDESYSYNDAEDFDYTW